MLAALLLKPYFKDILCTVHMSIYGLRKKITVISWQHSCRLLTVKFYGFFGTVQEATIIIIIIIIIIIRLTSTKPHAEILKLNKVNGCNDISFGYHSILEGDRIPLLKSHGQALEEELCFPDGVLSDNSNAPANLLRHFYGCLVPCTCCLDGKETEDVGAGQTAVFVRLALCCSVSCYTCFDHCAADMGLGVCVWYCYVPGLGLTSPLIIIICIW